MKYLAILAALLLAVSAQGQPTQYKAGDTVLIHTNKMDYPYTHNAPKLPGYMFWRLYRNGENYPEWKNDWYRAEVDTANYAFVDEVWVRLHKIKLTAKQRERLMELLEPPNTNPFPAPYINDLDTRSFDVVIEIPPVPIPDTLPDSVWVAIHCDSVDWSETVPIPFDTVRHICESCGRCYPFLLRAVRRDMESPEVRTVQCQTYRDRKATVLVADGTIDCWGYWKKEER